jgi:DNA mismatch repair protein MutS2
MNQAGLALPAAEGTTLPVFDSVFINIGDDQSIENGLSTFSSHIRSISEIINRAKSKSLVLLDELGSGTAPEEGSAIAMAVCDSLIEANTISIITSHHASLKKYAWTKTGVENASVEFDMEKLLPTYKIIMGLPGESRAMEIALQNSLPQKLVEAAKQYLDSGEANISELIKTLEQKLRDARDAEIKNEKQANEIKETKRLQDLKELRFRQRELEIKKSSFAGVNSYLSESRKKLENLVKELREGEITREKTLSVKEFLLKLESGAKKIQEDIEADEASLSAASNLLTANSFVNNLYTNRSVNQKNDGAKLSITNEFAAGDEVIVIGGETGGRKKGIIKRKTKKGFYDVEIGSLTLSLDASLLLPSGKKKPVLETQFELSTSTKGKIELMLRGMRAEEALDALRLQLDAAVIEGLFQFAVIHGKGDGILQREVHAYLKTRPEVNDFFFSPPELGGTGRTEVRLGTG